MAGTLWQPATLTVVLLVDGIGGEKAPLGVLTWCLSRLGGAIGLVTV